MKQQSVSRISVSVVMFLACRVTALAADCFLLFIKIWATLQSTFRNSTADAGDCVTVVRHL